MANKQAPPFVKGKAGKGKAGTPSGTSSDLARARRAGLKNAAKASDHVAAHTFAGSTIPRADGGPSSPTLKRKQKLSTVGPLKQGKNTAVGPAEPDEDDVRKVQAADGQKSFPKGGIIKPSRKGLFTAKARAAGMAVQAFARAVLANPKRYDPETVRQANFARNFGGGAKSKAAAPAGGGK